MKFGLRMRVGKMTYAPTARAIVCSYCSLYYSSPVQGDDDEDESRCVEAEYPEEDPGHDDD